MPDNIVHPSARPYEKNIGKPMWDRDHKEAGIITNVSTRICKTCGFSPCFIVRWPNGRITKPCIGGCESPQDGSYKIS